MYFHTLQLGAYLEEHAGDPARAADLRAQAAQLRERINATFYDEDAGLYRVSESNPGIAQDANVFAVLFGVAPEGEAAGILQRLKDQMWTPFGTLAFSEDTAALGFQTDVLSPFITGFETQTRLAAGDAVNGLDLMRRHFGTMVRSGIDDSGALWEKLSVDGTAVVDDGANPIDNNSLAHGWATSPLTALSENVLGVAPVDPGYATWRLAPHLGDLLWAKGQVPTPHGPFTLQWAQDRAGSYLRGFVTAPAGTRGELVLPIREGDDARVKFDGEFVDPQDPIAIEGGRRKHIITVTYD